MGAIATSALPGRWTVLHETEGRPGWDNMARDLALLDLAERDHHGFVRLYRWDPWCLSFGRHEPAGRRYDRQAIERRGLATVRRPTGGRAVWHARELTYALAAPTQWFDEQPGMALRASYRSIHALLAAALRRMGAAVEQAPRPAAPSHSGPCFATAAGGEITAQGRKLAGSAQLRRGGALLQHGSVLLGLDQSLLREVGRDQGAADHAVSLSQVLAREVGFAEAARALVEEIETNPEVVPCRTGLIHDVERRAAVHQALFRSPDWTWRR
jgi:lipoyl(octanoyl) transferase